MLQMKKNDIWFSADLDMILGAKRHGGFVPWNIKFQVIMTPESYAKMKRLFPDNVVDSFDQKLYMSLKPVFVLKKNDWNRNQPFVEIRIVVPTTIKKIKNFTNPLKLVSKPIKSKNVSIKSVINELFDQVHEGFYVVEKRSTPTIKCWIPNISFNMEEIKFVNLKIPYIKEWKQWMIANYKENYMTAVIPAITYSYPAPLKVIKEED